MKGAPIRVQATLGFCLALTAAFLAGWCGAWWFVSKSDVGIAGVELSLTTQQETQLLQRADELMYLLDMSRAWLDYNSNSARESRTRAWEQFRPQLQERLQDEYRAAMTKIERHDVEQRLHVQRVEQIGERRYRVLGHLELQETRPGTSRRKLSLPIRQLWEIEMTHRDLRHTRGLRIRDWSIETTPGDEVENGPSAGSDPVAAQGYRLSVGHSLQIQFPCTITQVDLQSLGRLATSIRTQTDGDLLTLMPIETVREATPIQVSCGPRRANILILPGPSEAHSHSPVDRYGAIASSSVKSPRSPVLKVKKTVEEEMGFVIDEASRP